MRTSIEAGYVEAIRNFHRVRDDQCRIGDDVPLAKLMTSTAHLLRNHFFVTSFMAGPIWQSTLPLPTFVAAIVTLRRWRGTPIALCPVFAI